MPCNEIPTKENVMSEIPTPDQLKLMTAEEINALHRKMTKRAMRNMFIMAGVKVAISYGLYRWAKSVNENI